MIRLSMGYKPLAAIVCGFEQGGTTLLSEVLRQHPDLNSGFEGGLLLGDKPSEFKKIQPYCDMLKISWEIDDKALQHICDAEDWLEAYQRLVECSSIIKNKDGWIFDKTPKYMQILPSILEKIDDIPCIVIVRDPRAVLYSWSKRFSKQKQISIEEWLHQGIQPSCNRYMSYINGYKKAVDKGYKSRILLVKYENLCRNQEQEFKKIFEFIGFEFNPAYLRFTSEFNNVHGSQISKNYLKGYINNIPDRYCKEILQITESESDLLWDTED